MKSIEWRGRGVGDSLEACSKAEVRASPIRTNNGDMANEVLRTLDKALCYLPSLDPNWFWRTGD